MRTSLRSIAILLLLVSAAHAAGKDALSFDGLRSLATQIKNASDQVAVGSSPPAATVPRLERALTGLRNASATTRDPQFLRKLQATELLFAKLKYQASHPSAAPARPASSTRAQIDIEVVTGRHGASCEAALGISQQLPVRLVLAQAGSSGSDAWFRFEPGNSGYVRFKTDSSGADPALQVFRSCAANAPAVAANDDSLGLDASVAVSHTDHTPLFVHLTNSGQGGPVILGIGETNGTVSGTVTAAGTNLPLVNVQVDAISDGNLFSGGYAFTDQNGAYSIPLSPGTYYLQATQGSYIEELYPDAPCFPTSYSTTNCAIEQAQAITVADNTNLSNLNFSLSTGQNILGQIRDTSNQPIAQAIAALFDGSGNQLDSTQSDSAGHYSFSTMPNGTYKVSAQGGGYGSQMFNRIACAGQLQSQCDLTQASPIGISGHDVDGVNFDLTLLAAIQGTVLGFDGQAASQYSSEVYVSDADGNILVQTSANSDGNYSAGPLALGNYYVYATSPGYFSQIFNSVDCGQDCLQSMASASAIAITQTSQQVQANFALHLLPTIVGHVQDAATSAPLANVTVAASINPPASFSPTASAVTDSSGNYTLSGITPGVYYLWAQSSDHIDQVYSGIPCENESYYYYSTECDVTGATLLTIAPGQAPGPFDFALTASSAIGGSAITRAGAGSDLPAAVTISIYNGAGTVVGSTSTDAFGNYIVNDLPAGNYFAAIQNDYYYNQFVEQIWQQIDCPDTCAPTTGTLITVAPSSSVGGIDFLLTRLDAVVGRITDSLGAPISGAVIDTFASSNQQYVSSAIADAQGYYAAQGNIGNSFFVATEAGPGYIDQVYAGIACPLGAAYYGLCELTNATAVGLPSSSSQPHVVNFVLLSNDPIFRNGFDTP